MEKLLLLVTVLASCGDNISVPQDSFSVDSLVYTADATQSCPVATWKDAQTMWGDGWCAYAQRCFPDGFASVYSSQEMCVQTVADSCDTEWWPALCASQYPLDRCSLIIQCESEMANVLCDVTQAPQSCFDAFQIDLSPRIQQYDFLTHINEKFLLKKD